MVPSVSESYEIPALSCDGTTCCGFSSSDPDRSSSSSSNASILQLLISYFDGTSRRYHDRNREHMTTIFFMRTWVSATGFDLPEVYYIFAVFDVCSKLLHSPYNCKNLPFGSFFSLESSKRLAYPSGHSSGPSPCNSTAPNVYTLASVLRM